MGAKISNFTGENIYITFNLVRAEDCLPDLPICVQLVAWFALIPADILIVDRDLYSEYLCS